MVLENMKIENKYKNMVEEAVRVKNRPKRKTIMTGVNAIDEPLGGLMNSSLLVIGSETGVGKTQLAKIIATNCAKNKIRVFLLALEAHKDEHYCRMFYNKFTLNTFHNKLKKISYKDWYNCNFDENEYRETIKQTEKDMDPKIEENIIAQYRLNSEYNASDLDKDLNAIRENSIADLVIIDHLHYFSFESDRETSEISKIMKKIRDLSLVYEIPIILFSHLRKKTKNDKSLVPDENEFHGSSEIVKNATAVLTIASDYENKSDKTYLFPTFFRFCKNRFDGSTKRYLLTCNFDARDGTYEDEYKIAKVNRFLDEADSIKTYEEMPDWAKHGKITKG